MGYNLEKLNKINDMVEDEKIIITVVKNMYNVALLSKNKNGKFCYSKFIGVTQSEKDINEFIDNLEKWVN